MLNRVTPVLPFTGIQSQIIAQVPLKNRTTWRLGGVASWLAMPANIEELAELLSRLPEEIPRFILGGGSNILVEDAGFAGVAIDLGRYLNKITLVEEAVDTLLTAEAGVTTSVFAHYARRQGLAGAEFLGGIPG